MEKKWYTRGWFLGGMVGLIIGILFNLNGNIIRSIPSYSFGFNFLAILEGIVIGCFFGWIIQKNLNRTLITSLLSGLLGSVFGLYVILNAQGDGIYSGLYSVGRILFKGIVLYPLQEAHFHSFFVLFAFLMVIVKWLIIGFVIGLLIMKLKK